MLKSFIRRLVFFLPGTVVACMALFLTLSVPAYAATTSTTTTSSPVGTWTGTLTFTSGPLTGVSLPQSLTFKADGTVTTFVANETTGNGVWYFTGTNTFDFSLIEPDPDDSAIRFATNQATFLSNNHFTANGSSITYFYNGNPPVQVTGISDLTRSS